MASEHDTAHFAAELTQRLDALIEWAIQHWPEKNQPLTAQDFLATQREIALLLGARLHAQPPSNAGPAPADGGAQYVNVAPAPWP